MSSPQVGGIRSVGNREDKSGAGSDLPAPRTLPTYKHQFQSRKASLQLSLKPRTVHWKPDGTKEEETPTSSMGTRLDIVRFNDHHFYTNDDELADAIEALPPEVFSLEGQCWRIEDRLKNQRDLRAAEIRAAIAADPDLANRVLRPSKAQDFKLDPAPEAADTEATHKPR